MFWGLFLLFFFNYFDLMNIHWICQIERIGEKIGYIGEKKMLNHFSVLKNLY